MFALTAGNCIYHLVDDGLANLLGLETLRHGTNPVSYVSIALFGGNPSHGGTAIGSTYGWASDKETASTKGYFYLFKAKWSYVYQNTKITHRAKKELFPLWAKRYRENFLVESHLS
jgi:hypothetical protein